MGTWGTAISSNDTYADIYSEFTELYNDGMNVPEITAKLISEYPDIVNDPDDSNNFWFAIAKAQWDYKQTDSEIFNKVRNIINSGTDLQIWEDLDASEKDIAKRKIILDKFLETLESEKSKAKARKKIKITTPYFEKGECFTFKLDNGNYGGAVVLEATQVKHLGVNLIATTRINQPEKPSLKDFENAEVLVLNHSKWDNKPYIKWVSSTGKYSTEIEPFINKIGKLDVKKHYDSKTHNYMYGSFYIIEQLNLQFESEKTKEKPTIKITIKSLIKEKTWKFWQ